MQAVLNCTVFARNLTECGNKGKYGRQAALHSPMVGRCARGQGLGGPYPGGEVNTEHESRYNSRHCIVHLMHIVILLTFQVLRCHPRCLLAAEVREVAVVAEPGPARLEAERPEGGHEVDLRQAVA